MDIWVRSQHGSILTKVDGIYIQERGMNGSYMFDLIGMQRGGGLQLDWVNINIKVMLIML